MIIAPLNPAFKISGRVYVYGRVRMRGIPSDCGCSKLAAEAAKVVLGWLRMQLAELTPTLLDCQSRPPIRMVEDRRPDGVAVVADA